VVGSERRGRRSGLRERAGRLSMKEAAKAAEEAAKREQKQTLTKKPLST
jgi:hypothetical protein